MLRVPAVASPELVAEAAAAGSVADSSTMETMEGGTCDDVYICLHVLSCFISILYLCLCLTPGDGRHGATW